MWGWNGRWKELKNDLCVPDLTRRTLDSDDLDRRGGARLCYFWWHDNTLAAFGACDAAAPYHLNRRNTNPAGMRMCERDDH